MTASPSSIPHRLTPERQSTDRSLQTERDCADELSQELRAANESLLSVRQTTEKHLLQERQSIDEEIAHLRRLLTEDQRAHTTKAKPETAFVEIMARDLKIPACFIVLAADLLLENNHPSSGEAPDTELIQHIRQSASQMLRLIQGYTELTAAGRGR